MKANLKRKMQIARGIAQQFPDSLLTLEEINHWKRLPMPPRKFTDPLTDKQKERCRANANH